MTLEESLGTSIRFAMDQQFNPRTVAYRIFHRRIEATGCPALAELVAGEAAEYVGAQFVAWGQQVPASAIAAGRDHCWAEAVYFGEEDSPRGALVVWSSAARETEARANNPCGPTVVSLDQFHAARSHEA